MKKLRASEERKGLLHWLGRLRVGQVAHISEHLLREAFPGDAREQGLSELGEDIMLFAHALEHRPPPRFRSPQEQIDDFFTPLGFRTQWNHAGRYLEVYRLAEPEGGEG